MSEKPEIPLPADAVDRIYRTALAFLPAANYNLVEAMRLATTQIELLNQIMGGEGLPIGAGNEIVLRLRHKSAESLASDWVLRRK